MIDSNLELYFDRKVYREYGAVCGALYWYIRNECIKNENDESYWCDGFVWMKRSASEWADFFNIKGFSEKSIRTAINKLVSAELIRSRIIDPSKHINWYTLCCFEYNPRYQKSYKIQIPNRIIRRKPFSETKKLCKYIEQQGCCAHCRTHFALQDMECDHIIPFSKGGTSDYRNLQLLCKACNLAKSNKYIG